MRLILALLTFISAVAVNAEIYQWVDEHGRMQFGDKPPADAQSTNLTSQYQSARNFNVEVIPHRYQMGLDVKSKITVAVGKIFELFYSTFGLTQPSESGIAIHIYGDKQEFQALTKSVGLAIENASGFYSPRDNAVHVWQNRDLGRLLRVLTHEVSHAVFRYHIRRGPAWVKEGLAEYFENMEVYGQVVAIHPSPYSVDQLDRRLRDDSLLSPRSYLQLTNKQWYAYNDDQYIAYKIAWSMTYFLMSSSEGRGTLTALLHHFRDWKKYDRTAATRIIEETYPDGLDAFSEAWRVWVLYDKKQKHRY